MSISLSQNIPECVKKIIENNTWKSHFQKEDSFMENKVKIGVIGVGRGRSMINYCKMAQNAELVAV